MKKLFVLIVSLLFIIRVSGQEDETSKTKNNEFGFHLGATTGLGLSYRHWFGNAGFQLTGLPIKTQDLTMYSIGVTGLYTFHRSRLIKVFGYLGNHYIVNNERQTTENWNNGYTTYDYTYTYNSSYNIGFGPGFAFGKTVTFNLMVGYGFFDVLETFNIYPTGEIGVYYNF